MERKMGRCFRIDLIDDFRGDKERACHDMRDCKG
jgi:hypothetical protein